MLREIIGQKNMFWNFILKNLIKIFFGGHLSFENILTKHRLLLSKELI